MATSTSPTTPSSQPFLATIWASVFSPGVTPALVVATNATFCSLQTLLVILLFATGSFHFLAMSVICGGLWWSINWVVREIEQNAAHNQTRVEKDLLSGSETETEPSSQARSSGIRTTVGNEDSEHKSSYRPGKGRYTPSGLSGPEFWEKENRARQQAALLASSTNLGQSTDRLSFESDDPDVDAVGDQSDDHDSTTTLDRLARSSLLKVGSATSLGASGDGNTDSEWERVSNA